MLTSGLARPEIAEQLVITSGTVRDHLNYRYDKLEVHSRLRMSSAPARGLL